MSRHRVRLDSEGTVDQTERDVASNLSRLEAAHLLQVEPDMLDRIEAYRRSR